MCTMCAMWAVFTGVECASAWNSDDEWWMSEIQQWNEIEKANLRSTIKTKKAKNKKSKPSLISLILWLGLVCIYILLYCNFRTASMQLILLLKTCGWLICCCLLLLLVSIWMIVSVFCSFKIPNIMMMMIIFEVHINLGFGFKFNEWFHCLFQRRP